MSRGLLKKLQLIYLALFLVIAGVAVYYNIKLSNLEDARRDAWQKYSNQEIRKELYDFRLK